MSEVSIFLNVKTVYINYASYIGNGCLVAKSSLTLCDPVDCSPPGSSVYGIL